MTVIFILSIMSCLSSASQAIDRSNLNFYLAQSSKNESKAQEVLRTHFIKGNKRITRSEIIIPNKKVDQELPYGEISTYYN